LSPLVEGVSNALPGLAAQFNSKSPVHPNTHGE
jgi:hypothetical protein